MNKQVPEKVVRSEELEVEEIFQTIQGEGPLSGRCCVFVRLSGCTLQCQNCVIGSTLIYGPGVKTRIDEIRVGDLVFGWDYQKVGIYPVLETMVREVNSVLKITFNGVNPLYVTPDHPGWVVGRQWVPAKDWKVGDVLFNLTTSEMMQVFNPMVDEDVKNRSKASRIENGSYEKSLKALKEKWKDPAFREQQSQAMRERNPMKNIETRKKSWTNREHHLTNVELMVNHVIEELELPIEFVGDGSFWVEDKCPDFKVLNENKVIEVWDSTQAEYLDRDEHYVQQRRQHYQEHGYECLILAFSQSEFREKGDVKGTGLTQCRQWLANKLNEFIHNGKTIVKIELINRFTKPKAYTRLAGSLDKKIKVYNLEVATCHNYFANSVLLHNCDTVYTINRQPMSVTAVLEEILTLDSVNSKLVIVTGGEPFRQPRVVELIRALCLEDYTVQVETSGSVFPVAEWQRWIEGRCTPLLVCSPKTPKLATGLTPYITAYKYVVREGEVDLLDGLPNVSPINGKPCRIARPVINQSGALPPIYISPWEVPSEDNVPTAVAVCLKHGYRLSLQIHKLIGVR